MRKEVTVISAAPCRTLLFLLRRIRLCFVLSNYRCWQILEYYAPNVNGEAKWPYSANILDPVSCNNVSSSCIWYWIVLMSVHCVKYLLLPVRTSVICSSPSQMLEVAFLTGSFVHRNARKVLEVTWHWHLSARGTLSMSKGHSWRMILENKIDFRSCIVIAYCTESVLLCRLYSGLPT